MNPQYVLGTDDSRTGVLWVKKSDSNKFIFSNAQEILGINEKSTRPVSYGDRKTVKLAPTNFPDWSIVLGKRDVIENEHGAHTTQ